MSIKKNVIKFPVLFVKNRPNLECIYFDPE